MQVVSRDEGSATLEIAILGPALLLLVFTVVQVALVAHARNLATAAAQEGVNAAVAYGAQPGDGASRAREFLADVGADSISEVDVEADGSPTAVRIVVSGRSLTVLPGVPGVRVEAAAQAPRERFVPDLAP